MQLTLRFAVVAAVLTAVRGAAVVDRATTLERAEDLEARAAQIYICTDDEFSGSCTNYGFVNNRCSNFPSAFQDNISSFGPDPGWWCRLYVDRDCNEDQGAYDGWAPGYSHLEYGNDAFSSVRCWRR